jgi:hypothetical protein
MQQALKPVARVARTEIVATELLAQFDVAVNEPSAALDMGFRGI